MGPCYKVVRADGLISYTFVDPAIKDHAAYIKTLHPTAKSIEPFSGPIPQTKPAPAAKS